MSSKIEAHMGQLISLLRWKMHTNIFETDKTWTSNSLTNALHYARFVFIEMAIDVRYLGRDSSIFYCLDQLHGDPSPLSALRLATAQNTKTIQIQT